MLRLTQLILSLLSFLLFSCSHNRNDLQKAQLKGKVKSIAESYNKDSKDTTDFKTYYEYNMDGNLVEKKLYNNGSLLYNADFIYNDKGKLIEKNTFVADSIQEKIIYNLDGGGNIAGSIDTNFKLHTIIKSEYLYDSKNDLIEADAWNSPDSLKSTHTFKNQYKYDDKNNVIEEEHFDIKGAPEEKLTSVYDNDGNLISIEIYSPSANPTTQKFTYKYEFDKTRNWISQSIFSNDTLLRIKKRDIEYY
jgi:hypothetical protein